MKNRVDGDGNDGGLTLILVTIKVLSHRMRCVAVPCGAAHPYDASFCLSYFQYAMKISHLITNLFIYSRTEVTVVRRRLSDRR